MDYGQVAAQALQSDPVVILAIGLVAFALTGIIGLVLFFRMIATVLAVYGAGREREVKATEDIAGTLLALRIGNDQQHSLNTHQVNLLQALSTAVGDAGHEIQQTHQDVKALHEDTRRGFDDTKAALNTLPERLAAEVKPVLAEIDQLRLKMEAAKASADNNHKMLTVELARLQTIFTTRLDAAIMATSSNGAVMRLPQIKAETEVEAKA